MAPTGTKPWDKPARKKPGRRPTKLSAKSIAKARAAAKKAGRRYPNLVDNMNAARQQREAEERKSRSKEKGRSA